MVRNSLLIVSVVCIRFGLYVGACVTRWRRSGRKIFDQFIHVSVFITTKERSLNIQFDSYKASHLRLVRPQLDLKEPVGVLTRDWLIPTLRVLHH